MALNRLLINDDILLENNNIGSLHETKRIVIRSYIDIVLDRFSAKDSKPGNTHVAKGDKFCIKQRPTTDLEKEELYKVPYSSAAGSLMYVQVCTRPDLAFIVGVFGIYLSNSGMQHWIVVKRVMRSLKRTRDSVLTNRKSDNLEIIWYSDSDFAGCPNSRRSTSGYIFLLDGGAVS
ncbi:secreted RxLR effector protein 161-like [Lathyrus oleraceus]|uniref:secreted RxLR effector protein 161-like n=1 Tax=Pisum sativum TaxID=3888 RepID=UPI0021D32D70|nr:secreted RxLR effector protein 161-like [Pisum sativum]